MKLNIWIILATMHTFDFTKTTARSDAEPRIQSFVGSCLHIFMAQGYQKTPTYHQYVNKYIEVNITIRV